MSELSGQLEGKAISGADPVAVTSAVSTVIGPVDIQPYDRFTVYVLNSGGGNGDDITVVNVETAPTEDGPWVELDDAEVLEADLVADASTYQAFNAASLKYIRLRANCDAAKTTTARFWLCMGGLD